MTTRAIGIMLLGSVPSPPKNPMSWTSTQSARLSTVRAAMAGKSTGRQPLSRASPISASAATTNRFTANACAPANVLNALISVDRECGCGVWAIDWAMLASVPGLPCTVPCQKPRPGQACSTAMPAKNAPITARMPRPSRGLRQAVSGKAMSAPATL